jgi:hypothetical protein
MVKMIQTRADPADQGSGMGHEDAFPRTRLSAGYGFRKETIAGVRHNERDRTLPLRSTSGKIRPKQPLPRLWRFEEAAV